MKTMTFRSEVPWRTLARACGMGSTGIDITKPEFRSLMNEIGGEFVYVTRPQYQYMPIAAAGMHMVGGMLRVRFYFIQNMFLKNKLGLLSEIFSTVAKYGEEHGYASVQVPCMTFPAQQYLQKILEKHSSATRDFTHKNLIWYEIDRNRFERLCGKRRNSSE